MNSEVGAAAAARQAAGRIFRLVDEELLIDPLGEGGAKGGDHITAAVGFKNIKFAYPERPDAQVGLCIKRSRKIIRMKSLCERTKKYPNEIYLSKLVAVVVCSLV